MRCKKREICFILIFMLIIFSRSFANGNELYESPIKLANFHSKPIKEWELHQSERFATNPVLRKDGGVYILVDTNPQNLLSIDKDGRILWKVVIEKPDVMAKTSELVIDKEDNVYVGDYRKVYAFEKDGKCKWSRNPSVMELPKIINANQKPEKLLYFKNYGQVYALTLQGELYWKYRFSPELIGNFISTPIMSDNIFYATEYTGVQKGITLYAINREGKETWTFKKAVEDEYRLSPPALDKNGNVYIGSNNGLNALDRNGKLKWHLPLKRFYTDYSPKVDPIDNTIYYDAFIDNTLIGLAITPEGKIKWKMNLIGERVLTTPSMRKGGVLYFLSLVNEIDRNQHYLTVIDLKQLSVIYHGPLPETLGRGITPSKIDNGFFFITGNIYRKDEKLYKYLNP